MATLLAPAVVSAQQAPAADPTTLDAVTVTATQAPEVVAKEAPIGVLGDLPLVETPFSVNVITRALIDKQQAAFLGDFLKNDPSAAVGNVAVPFALLRGFSIGSSGQLYDGLPGHGGISDGRAGLQSIDRIDVLKGASAFLYGLGGSTSLGGTLNYLPKRPTDAPLRSAAIGYTSRSLLNLEADLGDRFGAEGQFGYRLNLGYRDGEQAVARYDWQQQVGALALDWRATPDLLFTYVLDHVDNHIPELPPFYALAPGVAVPEAPDAERSAALSWDDFKTRSTVHYLRADWAIAPGWSLTAQGLHGTQARPRVKEARFGFINDDAGNTTLFGSEDASENDIDSAQLLLHGKLATGALRHRLTLGLNGSREQTAGASASLGTFDSNLYQPVDAPEPASALGATPLTSRTRSSGLMLSDLVDLSERWSALLGVRRARLTVDNYDAGVVSSRNSSTETLPVAALMFKPRPGALVYLNYAEGLEPGGSLSPTNTTQFLPPILTEQFELGGKLEWDALSFTAALFDMRRPLETFDAGLGRNVQRGEQRHRGLELVLNGRITPALTLVAGTMLLDARIDGRGDPATDGRRAPGVPRLTANLWGEYRVAALAGLALNAGLYHAGAQHLDGANTQRMPSWTRLDVGASLDTRVAGAPTTLLLGIENLANRSYWASAQGGILTIADPRTVKATARFAF